MWCVILTRAMPVRFNKGFFSIQSNKNYLFVNVFVTNCFKI